MKHPFFDSLAEHWDEMQDLPMLSKRIRKFFAAISLEKNERIMDLGCGTGNVTRELLDWLGPDGRVTAVDISDRMIEIAKSKIQDSRLSWRCADVVQTGLPHASFDRIICFSAWPHFTDPVGTLKELSRMLKPRGEISILHFISRAAVNGIHTHVGDPAIHSHLLLPVEELARLFAENGFEIVRKIDTDTEYLLQARKSK